MENAIGGLKIAFAVFIFMLGLTILFSMASRARDRAEVLISGTDRVSYYDYYEEVSEEKIDANGNRIVSIYDIVPVLYRYSQENYGVTIVDNNGGIVARFDLDTESACNNWPSLSSDVKENFINGTNGINSLLKKVNVIANNIGANNVRTINDSNDMEDYFKEMYYQKTNSLIKRNYYCYWLGSSEYIVQRIDSDLSRNIGYI